MSTKPSPKTLDDSIAIARDAIDEIEIRTENLNLEYGTEQAIFAAVRAMRAIVCALENLAADKVES